MMKYKTGELKELVNKLIDSLKKITLREWDAVQKQENVLANCLSHEEGRLRGFKLPGLTLNTAHFKCIKGKFFNHQMVLRILKLKVVLYIHSS